MGKIINFFKRLFGIKESPVIEDAPKTTGRISLSWETESNQDRKKWSDLLTSIIKNDIALYRSATDIGQLHPEFKNASFERQVKIIGEFWVAMAYYESGYNPKSSSVDVGSVGNLETYSVGLYQMSGVDSAAKKYGYKYEALKDPLKNIEVATEQMRRQIGNAKLIFLPNASKYRYWAVALIGNKYSKIAEIKSRILKNVSQ